MSNREFKTRLKKLKKKIKTVGERKMERISVKEIPKIRKKEIKKERKLLKERNFQIMMKERKKERRKVVEGKKLY